MVTRKVHGGKVGVNVNCEHKMVLLQALDAAYEQGSYLEARIVMTADEALELAQSLIDTAEKIDPLAEAKFRGIKAGRELQARQPEFEDCKKAIGYSDVDMILEKKGIATVMGKMLFWLRPHTALDGSTPAIEIRKGNLVKVTYCANNWMEIGS